MEQPTIIEFVDVCIYAPAFPPSLPTHPPLNPNELCAVLGAAAAAADRAAATVARRAPAPPMMLQFRRGAGDHRRGSNFAWDIDHDGNLILCLTIDTYGDDWPTRYAVVSNVRLVHMRRRSSLATTR